LVAVGAAILGLVILIALTAPWVAPDAAQGRGTADVANRDLAPSTAHLFGTDHLGRDIVSRVMFGTRPALAVSFVVVFAAILIGVAIGSVAGYLGGWVDEVLMRITDVFLSFPPLLLTMIIASLLGPSLVHAAIALVVSWWPWYARLVRTVAQSIRQRSYIEAARISGAPVYRILRRHVLRNSWSPVFVQAAIDFGTVILAAGSLAFLGLGAQPPTADWGLMVADGRTTVTSEWWIPTFPGLAIFVVVLGANLLGDGMQNLLKPGSGRR
jgi:peptide/nickel transport system permease protein